MRKLSAIFIMMFMTFALLPGVVRADTSGTNGSCTWTLDNDGNLLVKPTQGNIGTLTDWSSSYGSPWQSVSGQIKSVKFQNVKALTCACMFRECSNLTDIDLSGLDTSNVTNMHLMFMGCKSLKSIDLSKNNTSFVTNMSSMFDGCKALETLNLSGVVTSSVTDMGGMFYGCEALETLDLSNFKTSLVGSMESMFEDCRSLKTLDLSSFNTSSVGSMESMFYNCRSLNALDMSGFNTSSVGSMESMFYNCMSLKTLDLSSFNTSSVRIMNKMFNGCNSLNALDLSGFNTSSVESMESMFSYCNALKTLDLSSFNTSSVGSMESMFSYCYALKTLDLSGFNTSSVGSMSKMFSYCNALKTLDLSGFDTSSVEVMSQMFYNCKFLQKITVGDSWKTDNVIDSYQMFECCNNLVGGNGTRYDYIHTDKEYARVDNPPDAPGYLTHINNVPHTITLTTEGNGTAEPSYSSAVMGTEITLTAYPDTGSHVKEWQVVSGGVTIDENNKFTMGTKAVEIKVVFEKCSSVCEETEEVSATCTEDGTAAYWTCKTCGKKYSDKGCTTVITKPTVIPKGHTLVKTDEVKATCTEDGTAAYWTCSKCKKMFSDQGGKTEITKPAAIPKTGHNIVKIDEVKATCTKDGTEAYWICSKCKKMFSDQGGKTEIAKPKAISAAGHIWGDWTVSKEATYDTEGEERRICKNDASHVETKTIAKKVKPAETEKLDTPKPNPDPPKPNPDPPKPNPDVPLTPETEINEADAPTAKAQEKKILNLKSDSDPKGSVYGALQARMKKVSKNSITLKWKKIKGAKYTVYGNKCGKKNKYKKLKTVKGTSYTQKNLKEGTYYKYLVVAVKNGKAIATSKTIHAATAGGKVGNNKSVKVIKKTLSVAIGKTVKINASATTANKKLKVKKHRKIAFESSNTYIATVSKTGVVTGIRSGTCYVYAYAQNGVMAKITIKVS